MVEPDPALAAVKTYNYLRIALAALVLLLYTAVVLEWWAARPLPADLDQRLLLHAGARGVHRRARDDGRLPGGPEGQHRRRGRADEPRRDAGARRRLHPHPGCASSAARRPLLDPDIPAVRGQQHARPVRHRGGRRRRRRRHRPPRRVGSPGLSTADRLGLALSLAVLGGGIVWFFVARDSLRRARPRRLGHPDVPGDRRRRLAQRPRRAARRCARAPRPPPTAATSRCTATIAVAMLVALVATVGHQPGDRVDHDRALGRGRAHHACSRCSGSCRPPSCWNRGLREP